jgi:hypothetical protein
MFSTIATAVRSRGAVALVGATSTAFAMRSSYKWEREADVQYHKLLTEEAKVTELTRQVNELKWTLHEKEEKAAASVVIKSVEETADMATALSSFSAVVCFISYAMIAASVGRGLPPPI